MAQSKIYQLCPGGKVGVGGFNLFDYNIISWSFVNLPTCFDVLCMVVGFD